MHNPVKDATRAPGIKADSRLSAVRTASIFGLSLAVLLSTPALAQQSPEAGQNGGTETSGQATAPAGDIVVTAQRREQSLREVPVAVSVVGGQELQNSNLTSLDSLSQRLPAVKVTSGTITNSINIRGVGSGANAGFEQSVATFVDGIYRSRSRSTEAAMFDIDRLEVLKGPQTTFFGANAIAGALNITTRKPGFDFDYNASVDYVPATESLNLTGGMNLPVNDQLTFRIAGRIAESDGYVRNTITNENGPGESTRQGRISLRWEPGSSWRTDLAVEGSRSRTHNAMPAQLVGCPAGPEFTAAPVNTCRRYLAQNGGVIDGELDYRTAIGHTSRMLDYVQVTLGNSLEMANGGSIVALSGYIWQESGTGGQGVPFHLTDAVGGPNPFPTQQNEIYEQFSQELRYQSDAGGLFEYQFGGYVSWGKLDLQTAVGFRFLPFGAQNPLGTTDASTPVTSVIDIAQNDRTLSTFGSLTIRPLDALRINLGVRYSNVRKRASRFSRLGTADEIASVESFIPFDSATNAAMEEVMATNQLDYERPRRTDDKFMPSVSVQYDLTPDIMAYASYANGFKAGGYSTGGNNYDFAPETVDSYEIGLKGVFFDRLLSVNLAAYRSDYSDLQETSLVLLPNGAVTSVINNAAGTRAEGIEAGLSLRPASWVTFNADLAYTNSRYTDYPNGACTILGTALDPACIQDLTGMSRAYAPDWSGNFGANFDVPVFDGYRLKVDPLVYFSSGYFLSSAADPLLHQDGFAKVDLRIGIGPEDGRWELAVVGKNLTDKATSNFKQAVVLAPGSVLAVIDPPRTVGVQFRIRR